LTASQKISVSLLITVLLFAGFAVLAFTGLFDLVEARFYNPSISKGLSQDVVRDAQAVREYLDEMESRFSGILKEEPVRRSFLPNQSAEDIFERTKLFGMLLESVGGLQSVRFIDFLGKRIHFSTARSDVLRQDRLSVAYKNYGDSPVDLPFADIAAEADVPSRLIADAQGERCIFAYPFYDSFNVYKGTVLFSLSLRGLAERLIAEGRLRVGEELSLVREPAGVVSGLPRVGKALLQDSISSAWKDGALGPTPLASGESGISYTLVSTKARDSFLVARLVDEKIFAFPQAMKTILMASFFLTTYLTVFLLFNLRQDSITIIRDRIKRLQITLLEEYYDRKGDLDWTRWTRELDQRREEVRTEMKRGLGGKIRKKIRQDVHGRKAGVPGQCPDRRGETAGHPRPGSRGDIGPSFDANRSAHPKGPPTPGRESRCPRAAGKSAAE